MKINITIPVWNEEQILPYIIPCLLQFLELNLLKHEWFIVISDNNSNDRTSNIANKFCKENGKVHYLFSPYRGRGIAIKYSWLQYPADIYCYIDADLDINPRAIINGINYVNKGYDIVVGSKLNKESFVRRPWPRKLLTNLSNQFINWIWPAITSDPQCGFKLINKSARKAILPNLKEAGWVFDLELLLTAQHLGLRIKEIPVELIENRFARRPSKVSLISDSIKYFKGLVRLKKAGL